MVIYIDDMYKKTRFYKKKKNKKRKKKTAVLGQFAIMKLSRQKLDKIRESARESKRERERDEGAKSPHFRAEKLRVFIR